MFGIWQLIVDWIRGRLVTRKTGRMVLAVLTGLLVPVVLLTFLPSAGPWPEAKAAVVLFGLISRSIITAVTYHNLIYRFGPRLFDGETHCRKCDYILRGITEPRCPECGEWL